MPVATGARKATALAGKALFSRGEELPGRYAFRDVTEPLQALKIIHRPRREKALEAWPLCLGHDIEANLRNLPV